MTDKQQPQPLTQSQEKESIFSCRMIWIMSYACLFIKEYRSSLFEGYSVLANVLLILDLVPDEVYILHMDILYTEK